MPGERVVELPMAGGQWPMSGALVLGPDLHVHATPRTCATLEALWMLLEGSRGGDNLEL